MGSNSRYDRYRPVEDHEADEARALHTLGELVSRPTTPTLTRTVRGQIAHVLHATAIELDAGRAMPIGVRRAVLGLADALRIELAPPDEQPGNPGESTGAE
ncbi:MAG: hypothetical protein ACR2G2_19760 [Pseudonocardia sp.]